MRSQDSTSLCDMKYKVVFLGSMNVGKTSIIQRFIRDQFQSENYPTVGIDFLCRNIVYQQCTYRLQIWDTAGQQKYKSLVPAYLRDADSAVFVIDITDPKAIESLECWIQLFRDYQSQNSVCLLVGNKIDVGDRKISWEKGKEFANREGMLYIEVSAKTNENILNLFHTVINQINDRRLKNHNKQLTEEEKMSQNFFNKYNQIRLQQTLKKVPCCYL